jgi:hypothetical protein
MKNLRWGLSWGIAFACVLSLYAVGLATVRGTAPFDRVGISLGVAVAVYFGIGLVAGATAGLLRPYGRTRVGAICVGVVTGLPIGVGIQFVLSGPHRAWPRGALLFAVCYGAGMGGVAGLWAWNRQSRNRSEPDGT